MRDGSVPMTRYPPELLRRRGTLIAWIVTLTVVAVASLGSPLVVVLGLLAGLALGVGVAFGWDRATGRLRRQADVERATGLRVLARIPRQRGPDGDRRAVTTNQPLGDVAAYERLADDLVGTLRSHGGSTCLLVTSPTRRTGRTTVAANLAASCAADGLRVALISADPHGDPVDAMLGVRPAPGLTDVLDGSTSLDAALQATGAERLSVLAPGTPRERPIGYDLDGLATLLDRIGRDVDLLVLDAPPVLGGPDTVLLTQEVDHVLLAVDVRRGRRSDASVAVSYLAHVQDKFVGCVMTDPDRRRRIGARQAVAAGVRTIVGHRPRWIAAIATAAVAAVFATGWVLTYDDRSEAQPPPEETPDAAASPATPEPRSFDTAFDECQARWDAQSAPLAAAATAMTQWRTHVDTMNRLIDGRNTARKVKRFWERTRAEAARAADRHLDADRAYDGGRACRIPAVEVTDAEWAALSACQQGIAQRDATLRAARDPIDDWRHHLTDMDRLRTDRMSIRRVVRLWSEDEKRRTAELSSYRTESRQLDNRACSFMP